MQCIEINVNGLGRCHAISFTTSPRVEAVHWRQRMLSVRRSSMTLSDRTNAREVMLPWQCCVSHDVRRAYTGRRCRSMTGRASFEHDVTCPLCQYRLGDV